MNANHSAPPLCRLIPLKLTCLAILAVFCAAGLIAQVPQTQAAAANQPQPISLQHLYWHFLIHQSVLDATAAQLQSKGKDGNLLRNDLQTRLGFSEADYAPIRTSSQRLSSELTPINQQLKSLQAPPSSSAQIQTLIGQREAYIDNEVYNLSIELSAQNKAALEAFIKQFFAPKKVVYKAPPAAGQ